MIIFKDLLDEKQEFFCDQSFKYEEDDLFIKVQAKQINEPSSDLSNVNIGANPSAEGGDDEDGGFDGGNAPKKVIDVCFYHKLEECGGLFDGKKTLKKLLKSYLQAIKEKLKENGDDAKMEEFKKVFKDKFAELQDWVVNNADELEIYVGEEFEPPEDDGKMYKMKQGCAFVMWNEDQTSLTFYFLKFGVVQEKV